MKEERTLIFVSDLRGNYDILLDYVQFSKFIKWGDEFEDKGKSYASKLEREDDADCSHIDKRQKVQAERRLEFRNDCVVVFCGGVFDEDQEDARVARAVVDFKQRYPDQVILLLSPSDFQQVIAVNKRCNHTHNGEAVDNGSFAWKYADKGQLVYRHGSVLIVQNSIFQQFFLQDSLPRVWEGFLSNVFQEKTSEMVSKCDTTNLSSWLYSLNTTIYREILVDLQTNKDPGCLDGVKRGIDMGEVQTSTRPCLEV
eukprot:746135-Hanusia_phi.AAC.2